MRKFYLLIWVLLIAGVATAQTVFVTASAGTLSGSYPTLKGAFDAINAGTHQGAIFIDVAGNTNETASAVLNSGSVAPASYTSVYIFPSAPATISGTIGTAVIKLNGADNVTIDGSLGGLGNADRSLTVQNTSTAAGTAAIWLSSVAAGNGCSNNMIRSLEIKSAVDGTASSNNTFGIIMCGTSISTTSNGVDNDNNSFVNNRITKCRYGIVTRGTTTDLNLNPVITDNIIGPNAFGPDQISKTGIFLQADQGALVARNTVQFVGILTTHSAGGFDRAGIAIGTDSWSMSPGTLTGNTYTVINNVIHDIVEEKTFSAVGINLGATGGGSPTNNLVANNFIYNVRANGTSVDQAVGIGIAGGHSDKVVYNSIYMSGDVDPGGAAAATNFGSGIRIANASSASHANLTLANNIVHMDLFSSSTATVRFYAISGNAASYSFGTGGENYNDFFINTSNTSVQTGGLGTVSGNALTTQFATLANWQTAYATAQDANTIQADPAFISATNLHINTASISVDGKGTPVAGVTQDIDGDARHASTPDIGADEYVSTAIPCGVPASQPTSFVAGTVTSTSVAGSFTAAAGAPSGYIVIRSPGPFFGILLDGTTYPPGTVIGNGTVVQSSSATNFTATGLSPNTDYVFTIASYNAVTCTGGPVYNTTNMLTGNGTTCPQTPGSVTTSGVTSSSFTLNWASAAGGGAQPVIYTIDVATDAAFTSPVAGSPFTVNDPAVTLNVTGLTGNTIYYYRILAGNGCNSAYASGNLTTPCGVYTPTYLQNFATYVPACWSEMTGYLNGASVLTGSSSTWMADGWLNSGATGAAKINLFSTGRKDWLISPSIDLGVAGNYQLEFDLATLQFASTTTASVLGSDDSLAVVISTDDGATWTTANILSVWTAANTPVSASGLHVTIPLNAYTGIVKIGFYGGEGTVDDPQDVDVMIDNVTILPIPACGNISGLAASNITTSTVDLNWSVTPGATGYEFDVSTSPAPPVSGTPVATNSAPIGGLNSSTLYYAHVRSDCGGGLFGNWSTISFTTLLANDNASGAILLAVNGGCSGTPYTNSGATAGANEPYPSCSGTKQAPVWFKFVAPASGAVRVSTDYTGGVFTDSKMAIFSGTDLVNYSDFQIISCDDDGGSVVGSGFLSVVYATGLTPGTTYYIAVDRYTTGTTTGSFCVAVDEMNASHLSTTTSCQVTQTPVSNGSNAYTGWVPLLDAGSRLIALVRNPAGGSASLFSSSQNINTAAVRSNAGVFYLDRNYLISNSTATNADVQFFFLNSELTSLMAADPGVTTANLGAAHQAGTTCRPNFATANGITDFLPQTQNGITADGNVRWIQVTAPSFSNFYLQKGGGQILPAGLLAFAGQREGALNRLRWTTASEQNNRGFEVQRSTDGVNFMSIGFVNSQAVSGNSTGQLSYSFTDNHPAGARQYYRLRQLDLNNLGRMSNIVLIKGEKPASLAIAGLYPNPASTLVNVDLASPVRGQATIQVLDMTGKSVMQRTVTIEAGNNTIPMDISRLTKGTYLIKLLCESDCESAVSKFVKQ